MNALQMSKEIYACEDALTHFDGFRQRLLAQGVQEDSLVIQATNEVIEHNKLKMINLQKQLDHIVTDEVNFIRRIK